MLNKRQKKLAGLFVVSFGHGMNNCVIPRGDYFSAFHMVCGHKYVLFNYWVIDWAIDLTKRCERIGDQGHSTAVW